MSTKVFRVIFITGKKQKCKTAVVVCTNAAQAAYSASTKLKLPKEDIREVLCLSDVGEQVVQA